MADVPAPFGLVVATLAAAVGDTDDTGRAPDALMLEGTAVFTGSRARFVAGQTIYLPQAIPATITGGELQYLKEHGVPLTANIVDGVQQGWRWSVKWDLHTPDGTPVTLDGWEFDVTAYVDGDASTETDLSAFTPLLPETPGPALVKGDPGPPGEDGPPGVDGTAATVDVGATDTGAPGTSASVSNTGTPSAAVLAFTIPRGADGARGADGLKGDTGAPGTPGLPAPTNATAALTSATSAGTVSLEKAGSTVVCDITGLTCTGSGEAVATLPAGYKPGHTSGNRFLVDSAGDWWPAAASTTQILVYGPPPAGTVLAGSLSWKAVS